MKDRRLRSALTVLGIIVGIATIVALLAATQGFSYSVTNQFDKMGTTSIFVTPLAQGAELTSNDIAVMQKLDGVSAAVPFWLLPATTLQGHQPTSIQVMAISLNQINEVLPGLRVNQGSIPSSLDVSGALIGASIAHPSQSGASSVGVNQILPVTFTQSNTLNATNVPTGKSFVVTGTLQTFGQSFFINPDLTVFIPLAGGQSILHTDRFSGIIVVASDVADVDGVQAELQNVYGTDMRIVAVTSVISSIQSITAGIETLLGSTAAISIVAAFIVITTTMFTTVVERTKEIGLLKALGFNSRNIMSTFLVEATFTGFVGGIMGAALGSGLAYLVVDLYSSSVRPSGATRATLSSGLLSATGGGIRITPVITPELLIFGIVLATFVGALAGLLPAWRASRLTPVEALQSQ